MRLKVAARDGIWYAIYRSRFTVPLRTVQWGNIMEEVRTLTRRRRGRKKEKQILLEGVVREALKDFFRVEIFPDGRRPDPFSPQVFVLGYICGKIRKNQIRIVLGDRVRVSVSRCDFSRGRIIYRFREE